MIRSVLLSALFALGLVVGTPSQPAPGYATQPSKPRPYVGYRRPPTPPHDPWAVPNGVGYKSKPTQSQSKKPWSVGKKVAYKRPGISLANPRVSAYKRTRRRHSSKKGQKKPGKIGYTSV